MARYEIVNGRILYRRSSEAAKAVEDKPAKKGGKKKPKK